MLCSSYSSCHTGSKWSDSTDLRNVFRVINLDLQSDKVWSRSHFLKSCKQALNKMTNFPIFQQKQSLFALFIKIPIIERNGPKFLIDIGCIHAYWFVSTSIKKKFTLLIFKVHFCCKHVYCDNCIFFHPSEVWIMGSYSSWFSIMGVQNWKT